MINCFKRLDLTGNTRWGIKFVSIMKETEREIIPEILYHLKCNDLSHMIIITHKKSAEFGILNFKKIKNKTQKSTVVFVKG